MAASLISLYGLPIPEKLKSTQPGPRLTGSLIILPWTTGLGKPMLTWSKFQSAVDWCTRSTSCCGVKAGPDGCLRTSSLPLCLSLTFVPPTSMTRMSTAVSSPLEARLRFDSTAKGSRVSKGSFFLSGRGCGYNTTREVNHDSCCWTTDAGETAYHRRSDRSGGKCRGPAPARASSAKHEVAG